MRYRESLPLVLCFPAIEILFMQMGVGSMTIAATVVLNPKNETPHWGYRLAAAWVMAAAVGWTIVVAATLWWHCSADGKLCSYTAFSCQAKSQIPQKGLDRPNIRTESESNTLSVLAGVEEAGSECSSQNTPLSGGSDSSNGYQDAFNGWIAEAMSTKPDTEPELSKHETKLPRAVVLTEPDVWPESELSRLGPMSPQGVHPDHESTQAEGSCSYQDFCNMRTSDKFRNLAVALTESDAEPEPLKLEAMFPRALTEPNVWPESELSQLGPMSPRGCKAKRDPDGETEQTSGLYRGIWLGGAQQDQAECYFGQLTVPCLQVVLALGN